MSDYTVTCVYCGQAYPSDTPTSGAPILTEHIKICAKHPMRELEEKNKKLKRALFGLLGTEDVQELRSMVQVLKSLPDDDNKTVTINAIEIVLETL